MTLSSRSANRRPAKVPACTGREKERKRERERRRGGARDCRFALRATTTATIAISRGRSAVIAFSISPEYSNASVSYIAFYTDKIEMTPSTSRISFRLRLSRATLRNKRRRQNKWKTNVYGTSREKSGKCLQFRYKILVRRK